ncbi:hypothetical protein AB0E27_00380 [Streptomyces sparsogenes]|uniref:hypothetical protein n=1 Tax=Streptomyces sparsogenes TaxID=67365 RepID=UPI0033C7BB74
MTDQHTTDAAGDPTPGRPAIHWDDVMDSWTGDELYGAFCRIEQEFPGDLATINGARLWKLTDPAKYDRHLKTLLAAYVELVRLQQAEDREEQP